MTLALMSLLSQGCSEDIPPLSIGLDDSYRIPRMTNLRLDPAISGESYRWYVDGAPVASSRDYIFVADKEGSYNLKFEIIDSKNPCSFEFTVIVTREEVEYSPYISKVFEYCPAPGQFVNELPLYEEGDSQEDMVRKVQEAISGTNDELISLGGFGGYVTFGFDHTVINAADRPDFRIWGNALYEYTGSDRKGGSAEPGIVMVSRDINGNGLPDDPWYELKGSAHADPATVWNYSITYSRPKEGHQVVADPDIASTDVYYIPWKDSQGNAGFLPKNASHDQDYFPKWSQEQTLTFSGTLLPANAEDRSGKGKFYILYCFDRGYADNHPNSEADLCSFDIDDAIDTNGNPVRLPAIDFVRVYTALKQYCGWVGETSTEICRAADLNIGTGK